jgi:hypothetical protein
LSDGFFRLFLAFPLFAIQPVGPAQTHHRRNMTTCYWMNRLTGSAGRAAKQQAKTDGYPIHPSQPSLFQHLPAFPRRPRGYRILDALCRFCVAASAATSLAIAFQSPKSAESPLQILAAGVESSEDAPFVSSDFHFLPGDYLYFQFQIAGFAVKTAANCAEFL